MYVVAHDGCTGTTRYVQVEVNSHVEARRSFQTCILYTCHPNKLVYICPPHANYNSHSHTCIHTTEMYLLCLYILRLRYNTCIYLPCPYSESTLSIINTQTHHIFLSYPYFDWDLGMCLPCPYLDLDTSHIPALTILRFRYYTYTCLDYTYI